jgi:hypothetical protein
VNKPRRSAPSCGDKSHAPSNSSHLRNEKHQISGPTAKSMVPKAYIWGLNPIFGITMLSKLLSFILFNSRLIPK